MWPYTHTEYNWLAPRDAGSFGAPTPPVLTPELVEAYMRRGRKMRAEAAAEMSGAVLRAVRGWVAGTWHMVTDLARVAHHH